MDAQRIIEERVTIPGPSGALSGVLAYPAAGRPRRAALVCSPHPHFAGDMENNVVAALARELAEDAVTLRFDYRGVGDSRIELPEGLSVWDYWQDVEDRRDYRDALADVAAAAALLKDAAGARSLLVAGYSFGAAVALMHGLDAGDAEALAGVAPPLSRVDFAFLARCTKPALLLINTGDFLYREQDAQALRAAAPACVEFCVRQAGDHFFRGEEAMVCQTVRRFAEARCRQGCMENE